MKLYYAAATVMLTIGAALLIDSSGYLHITWGLLLVVIALVMLYESDAEEENY